MEKLDIKLLDNRVLIKPDEKITTTNHGLYIPESSQVNMHQGIVVAVGDGLMHPDSPIIINALNNILNIAISADLKPDQSAGINRYASIIDKCIDNGVMKVKVGDRVVYGKFSGTDLEIEGEKYVIMMQPDIKLIIGSKEEIDYEQLKK